MTKKQIDLLREFKKFTKEMEISCIYGKQEHTVNNFLFTSSPFSLEFKVNSNIIVVDFDCICENEKAYKIFTQQVKIILERQKNRIDIRMKKNLTWKI